MGLKKCKTLVKELPEKERNRLKDQMTRARRSVTNNIAEGYGRYHYQENIQYCRQSRGSICEIIDDLMECSEERYIDENRYRSLKEEAYSLMKILNNYISYLQKAKKEFSKEK
jgi:four helix bundle protein